LIGFLFEGGNQVGDVEATPAACIEHMLQSFLKNIRTNAIAQGVEKQQAFGPSDGGIRFRPSIALLRNHSEGTANDF
jgi:hypothetical protein